MSDAVINALPLTAIARQASAFKPLQALPLRLDAPTKTVDDYARGLMDGQQLAETSFEVEKEALLNLLANSQALKAEVGPELSILLRETVVGLVQQISNAIMIDTAFVETQIARAVALITEADEARQIILNPEDAALVGNQINGLAVRSDPIQPRGLVRIDCSQGWVEHGVAIGLERLREMLGVTA